MANQETQLLDEIIVTSRRKMLSIGATAFAGLALGAAPRAAKAATATYSDNDILNFALNLEYLEANFYYLAAFGTTIDVQNAASMAAGAPLITLSGTVGTAGKVVGGPTAPVPFSTTVGSYATETAIEEGKHVATLLSALGSSAVAQPAINLGSSFATVATAATIPTGATFTPYDSDLDFLLGAYIFEDVGVSAYLGAAALLTSSANLSAAAGILAVEGYHAGLVRTTINALDTTGTYIGYTNLISTLRATLSQAGLLGATPSAFDSMPDDIGLTPSTAAAGLGANGTASTITHLTDADPTNSIAFARNPTQILNIVTAGAAVNGTAAVSPAKGLFFPAGLNASTTGFF